MTPLDSLLTAVFADASPEGVGYAAAPLPYSPWVRWIKQAMNGQGHGAVSVAVQNGSKARVIAGSEGTTAILTMGGIEVAARAGEYAAFPESISRAKLQGPAIDALFTKDGYTHDGYTLRATSPTDITLSLSGETVTAEFNPPLRATAPVLLGLVKATRPIPRIKATERQLTIEIDGYSDQVIALTEPSD